MVFIAIINIIFLERVIIIVVELGNLIFLKSNRFFERGTSILFLIGIVMDTRLNLRLTNIFRDAFEALIIVIFRIFLYAFVYATSWLFASFAYREFLPYGWVFLNLGVFGDRVFLDLWVFLNFTLNIGLSLGVIYFHFYRFWHFHWVFLVAYWVVSFFKKKLYIYEF